MRNRRGFGPVWILGALAMLLPVCTWPSEEGQKRRATPASMAASVLSLKPNSSEGAVASWLRRFIASRLLSAEDGLTGGERQNRLSDLSYKQRLIRVEWVLREYGGPVFMTSLSARERHALWARRIAQRARTDAVLILESVGRDFRKVHDFDLAFDAVELAASWRGNVVIRARYEREAVNQVCLDVNTNCGFDRDDVFKIAGEKTILPPFDASSQEPATGGGAR